MAPEVSQLARKNCCGCRKNHYRACVVFCVTHFEVLILKVWNRSYGNRSKSARPKPAWEFSHPSQTSVISAPDLAIADRVFKKIKMTATRHETRAPCAIAVKNPQDTLVTFAI